MDLHHVEDVRATRDHHHHHHQLVLRERGRRIKAAAELGLARLSASRGRALGLGRRRAVVVPPEEGEEALTGKRQAPAEATPLEGRGVHHEDDEDEEDDDDEVVVEEKVALLRRLVPGGEDMAVEGLLEETADYIAALKAQVGVMRALTCLLSGSDLDGGALRPDPDQSVAGVLTPAKPM